MHVVDQLRPDQVFEEATLAARLLEVLQVGVKVERAHRVPAELVRGMDREQQPQGIWKAGVGSLALLELEVMDRGIDL